MKSRTLTCIIAITLFAALAIPVRLAAQHTRYKLIEIGTFGGPASYLGDPGVGPGVLHLNSRGVLIGGSETPDNCGNPDCFLSHAFRWEDGVLTDLGTLPGGDSSQATSINARGWIAGGSTTAEIDPFNTACGFQPLCPQFHGVLWKDGEIIDLGTLGEGLDKGLESNAVYVKDGGQVVGFSTINTVPDPASFLGAAIHPFIWKNGAMRDLGTLGGPDALASPGCANERSGLVTGFSFINSTPNPDTGALTAHAFLWQDGKMTDIPTLGGTLVSGEVDVGALCVNNRGQVAGASTLPGDSVFHPFLWDRGVLTDLGTLGGSIGTVHWLNDGGDVVGDADTANDESFHATLWKKGVINDLGTLSGDCVSTASAINSNDQIVGASFNCDTNTLRAVLWDKRSIVDLNTLIPANSSLELFDASQINDRGEIAGRALPPGCDDVHLCGHVFLLIPCDNDATCQGSAVTTIGVQNTAALNNRKSIASTQVLRTPMQRLAAWRARLAQRYHVRGLVPSPRD
jgi:probable HAF family extracellular repeat protein